MKNLTSPGVDRREPSYTVWTYVGAATVENGMEIPKKIENKTTIQSRNFTSGYLSEENENTNLKRYVRKIPWWSSG